MDPCPIEECERLIATYRERSGTLGGLKRLYKEIRLIISESPGSYDLALLPRLRDMMWDLARNDTERSDYLRLLDREETSWMYKAKLVVISRLTDDPIISGILVKMASIPEYVLCNFSKNGNIEPMETIPALAEDLSFFRS